MNFIPKKRKRPSMGLREPAQWRSQRHLKHVRAHECSLAGKPGHVCQGIIEAMHCRSETDGGTSVKPSDFWTMPGCSAAHREQHQIGEAAWEKRHGVNMKLICEAMAKTSPCAQEIREWKAAHPTPSHQVCTPLEETHPSGSLNK